MKDLLLPISLLLLSLISAATLCQQQEKDPGHKEEHHPHDTHANQFMHRSDFQSLVKHFEDPSRAQWQKPDTVIGMLGELSGKTVADIGAGSGYFTFPLAEKAKKVIAIDIDQRFLDYIEKKNASLPEKLPIETRLVEEDDPRLAPGEADVVIIVNTYHHIEDRPAYFKNVREKLNKNGALVVVDYFKKELPVGPPATMKLSEETVKEELKKAGFEDISLDVKTLEYQYIIIAR